MSDEPTLWSVLKVAGSGFADRYRVVGWLRSSMKKVFPDHWTFFLGELALYSFVILVITGIFLALFFNPSLHKVVYHGSYTRLDGVTMSEAYESTLHITFDIRGGLLMRQIHHWAADIFIAAISLHMLRIFFTGAFRRPREVNWMIGVVMFALAAAEGFFGYSMPDDMLSGTGLRIAQGIMLSVPVIGTYISFWVFGGQYPGHVFDQRFFITHVFIIPILLIALIGVHLATLWHQGHTQWPGTKQRENNEVGDPMFPVFMAKTGALFFFVFGTIALLATVAQINPIWMYGPYDPVKASALSQPDWYVGFMEGSLRLMPNVISNVGGHTFAWNVFLPAVALPIGFFLVAGLYPVFEEWVTGDLRHHQILDRPRHAPGRTALGAAVVAMGIDLLLAGSDDVITAFLKLNLYQVVWFFRVGFFAFPILAFFITRHVCRAMQRSERRKLAVGTAYGIASQDGGYLPVSRTLSEEQRARMEGHRPEQLIAPIPRHLIPLPTPRRIRAQIRARLNRLYTVDRLETRHGTGMVELKEQRPPEQRDGSAWPPVPRRWINGDMRSRGRRRPTAAASHGDGEVKEADDPQHR